MEIDENDEIDIELELLNSRFNQIFGEGEAAEDHKSVNSGGKEGLEPNILELSMERRQSGLKALLARIQRKMDHITQGELAGKD